MSAPGTPVLDNRLERFRAVRRELEASVLPLATSVDGRRFEFQASLHGLELRLGGYVMLEHEGTERLGQVLGLELDRRDGTELDLHGDGSDDVGVRSQLAIRYARGVGTILDGDGSPFHDALVVPASSERVATWLRATAPHRARLEIGELALAPGVPCELDAGGFDRHTFLCGQSGSGKTYSLGVMLERLLLETGLRIVILDPNSDFVRLGAVRDDVDEATAARYRAVAGAIAVHSGAGRGDERLRLRVEDLSLAAQGAMLRLDPIADREEHAEFAAMLAHGHPAHHRRPDRLGSPGARAGSACGRATSASTRSGCGRAASPARCSTRCATRRCAASSSTSAGSRRARSRRSRPTPCSGACGRRARTASPC